jgi:guanosine-3',5'-bis(diphosphate) 3'-pyrophosphohydrolase
MMMKAALYAAEKHKYQRRKGFNQVPYINHPLKVVDTLIDCGEDDIDLLVAAVLHDVIEDTDATEAELAELFNTEISKLVLEVSDDKDLPYTIRKEQQVKSAPKLSHKAKQIKIADKICNIKDILNYPLDWSPERKLAYLDWSKQVVAGCRGVNDLLESVFDKIFEDGTAQLKEEL